MSEVEIPVPVQRGTRVTATDLDCGESETVVIENDYLVICDGDRYVDGVQVYPGTGTAVITVKRKGANSQERAR